jgi:HAD superfamily hydrolase (TIGR01549 family)
VPLALFDLDDTLTDRRGSFRDWAASFAARYELDDDAIPWLEEVDGFGYVPREAFFAAVSGRYALSSTIEELIADYDAEYVTFTRRPSDTALRLLGQLRASGWRIGVVTNGHSRQLRKLATARIDGLVDGCCISEVEGVRKPDRVIFELAAERCGEVLAGGWMVGDNPDADIRGGAGCGLRTIWLRHGRAWTHAAYAPDVTVDTIEEALRHLVSLEHAA